MDIFLSYARPDREIAQEYVRALRAEGWTVFWDQDIAPGGRVRQILEEQRKAARVIVVLWTVDSVESHWVESEANRTLEDGGTVIPVLVGPSVRPPLGFDQLRWIKDLSPPSPSVLIQEIRRTGGLRAAKPPPKKKPFPYARLALALALIAAFSSLFAAWQVSNSNERRISGLERAEDSPPPTSDRTNEAVRRSPSMEEEGLSGSSRSTAETLDTSTAETLDTSTAETLDTSTAETLDTSTAETPDTETPPDAPTFEAGPAENLDDNAIARPPESFYPTTGGPDVAATATKKPRSQAPEDEIPIVVASFNFPPSFAGRIVDIKIGTTELGGVRIGPDGKVRSKIPVTDIGEIAITFDLDPFGPEPATSNLTTTTSLWNQFGFVVYVYPELKDDYKRRKWVDTARTEFAKTSVPEEDQKRVHDHGSLRAATLFGPEWDTWDSKLGALQEVELLAGFSEYLGVTLEISCREDWLAYQATVELAQEAEATGLVEDWRRFVLDKLFDCFQPGEFWLRELHTMNDLNLDYVDVVVGGVIQYGHRSTFDFSAPHLTGQLTLFSRVRGSRAKDRIFDPVRPLLPRSQLRLFKQGTTTWSELVANEGTSIAPTFKHSEESVGYALGLFDQRPLEVHSERVVLFHDRDLRTTLREAKFIRDIEFVIALRKNSSLTHDLNIYIEQKRDEALAP